MLHFSNLINRITGQKHSGELNSAPSENRSGPAEIRIRHINPSQMCLDGSENTQSPNLFEAAPYSKRLGLRAALCRGQRDVRLAL